MKNKRLLSYVLIFILLFTINNGHIVYAMENKLESSNMVNSIEKINQYNSKLSDVDNWKDLINNVSFKRYLNLPEFFYLDSAYRPETLVKSLQVGQYRDPSNIIMTDISSDDPDYKYIYNPVNISYHALISYYAYFYYDKNEEYISDFWRHLNWMLENEKKLTNGAMAVPYMYDWKAYPGYYLKAPWISALSQSFLIRDLIRAYWLTKDVYYLDKAKEHSKIFFITVENGGVLRNLENGNICFEEWPTKDLSLSLNGFMASIISLTELYKETKDKDLLEIINKALVSLDAVLKDYDYETEGGINWSSYDLHDRPVPVVFRFVSDSPLSIEKPCLDVSEISIINHSSSDFIEGDASNSSLIPAVKMSTKVNIDSIAKDIFSIGNFVPNEQEVVRTLNNKIPINLILSFIPNVELDISSLPDLTIKSMTLSEEHNEIWRADLGNRNTFPEDDLNGWGPVQTNDGNKRLVFNRIPKDNHSAFFINTNYNIGTKLRLELEYKYINGPDITLNIFDGTKYVSIGTIKAQASAAVKKDTFYINIEEIIPSINIEKYFSELNFGLIKGYIEEKSSPLDIEKIDVGADEDMIGSFSHIFYNSLSTWGERNKSQMESFRNAFGRKGLDNQAPFQLNLKESFFGKNPSILKVKYNNRNNADIFIEIFDGKKYLTIGKMKKNTNGFIEDIFALPMIDYKFAQNITKSSDFLATPSSVGYHQTHAVMLKTLYYMTGNEKFRFYADRWYKSLKTMIDNFDDNWIDSDIYIPKPIDKGYLDVKYDNRVIDKRGSSYERFAMLSDNENQEIIKRATNEMLQGISTSASSKEKVLAALQWISTNLKWASGSEETATGVYQSKEAICGGATKLFIEICRSLGLPARRVVLDNTNGINGHTTAEIWFNNKWNWFDPQFGLFCTSNGNINSPIMSSEELRKDPKAWISGGFASKDNVLAYNTGDLNLRVVGQIRTGDVQNWFERLNFIKGDFYPFETFTYAQPIYVDHSPEIPVIQPLAVDAPKTDEELIIGDKEGNNLATIQVWSATNSDNYGKTGVNISNIGVDSVGVNRNILLIMENAEVGEEYNVDFHIIGHSGGTFDMNVNAQIGGVMLTPTDITVPYILPTNLRISFRATRPTVQILLNHNYVEYSKLIQASRITISKNQYASKF